MKDEIEYDLNLHRFIINGEIYKSAWDYLDPIIPKINIEKDRVIRACGLLLKDSSHWLEKLYLKKISHIELKNIIIEKTSQEQFDEAVSIINKLDSHPKKVLQFSSPRILDKVNKNKDIHFKDLKSGRYSHVILYDHDLKLADTVSAMIISKDRELTLNFVARQRIFQDVLIAQDQHYLNPPFDHLPNNDYIKYTLKVNLLTQLIVNQGFSVNIVFLGMLTSKIVKEKMMNMKRTFIMDYLPRLGEKLINLYK